MKIFYCGVQYDHYNSRAGLSFEHENFFNSLAQMEGVEVRYFPFDDMAKKGKRQWNADLLAAAREEKPDLLFVFMLSDELDPRVLRELKSVTKTLAWFADDHWRFHNYSKQWAPRFTHVITTYAGALGWYSHAGIKNVIRSQWAANAALYAPAKGFDPKGVSDVAFIGGWTRPRQKIISALERAGIRVAAWGSGWPLGRVSQEKMVEIFSSAKINLALNAAPGFLNLNSLGRLVIRRSFDRLVFDPHIFRNISSFAHRGIRQIKARHFEIPACGGFLITEEADDIASYYAPGKEIVLYHGTADLIEKIGYYLGANEERVAIAKRAYERTIRDHTYEKRFREIFEKIGFHDTL